MGDGHGGFAFAKMMATGGAGPVGIAVSSPQNGLNGTVIDNNLPSTMLVTSDHFVFKDIDLNDVHTVSVSAQPGALGTLTAHITQDTNGSGTGEVTWDYQVSELTVHALTAATTASFAVTVNDGHGGIGEATVNVSLVPSDFHIV